MASLFVPTKDVNLKKKKNSEHCSQLTNVTETGVSNAFVGDYFRSLVEYVLGALISLCGSMECMCDRLN